MTKLVSGVISNFRLINHNLLPILFLLLFSRSFQFREWVFESEYMLMPQISYKFQIFCIFNDLKETSASINHIKKWLMMVDDGTGGILTFASAAILGVENGGRKAVTEIVYILHLAKGQRRETR